jgi:hypothetical protein
LHSFLATPAQTVFTIGNRGGISLTTSGTNGSVSIGYGRIQPNNGSTSPSGFAIISLRQNDTLVSEASVSATAAMLSGRIYAEIAGAVDAGLAIANPNSSAATMSFYFTDADGNPAGSGSTIIEANQQVARFLDQRPFNVYTTPTFQGTFSFASNVPVAVVALRGFTNESGDFLMSTLPVIDTTAGPANGTAVVPHFADGAGWTTQLFLVNPTDNSMTGTVQFMSPTGVSANVTIAGKHDSSFVYSIPKRTSQKLVTSGLSSAVSTGSIRIVPDGGGAGPTALIMFSYKAGGITISEAGVPVTSGAAFRAYVEASGTPGQIGSVESGLAVANTSTASVSVTLDVTDLNGATISGISPVTLTLPGTGQIAKFLSEVFPSLPRPFKGVLRIMTTSTGVSVVGLRTRINERGNFLMTSTPPTNENGPAADVELFLPQVVDGGGFTTQFILFSGSVGEAPSGVLKLITQNGSSFALSLN